MSYTLQMLISIKIKPVSPNSRSWESLLKLLRELSDPDLKIAFLLTDSYDMGQWPLGPHCGKRATRNQTGKKSNNKGLKKPNVGSDNPFPLGFHFSSSVSWCTWAYLQATKGRDCYYSGDAYPAITIVHENVVVVIKVCKGIAVACRKGTTAQSPSHVVSAPCG